MKRLLTLRQNYATPLLKMSYLDEEITTVPNERKRNWAAFKLVCMVAVQYLHKWVRLSLSQLILDPNYVASIGMIPVMKNIRMWNFFQGRLRLSLLTRLRNLIASISKGGLIVKRDTA